MIGVQQILLACAVGLALGLAGWSFLGKNRAFRRKEALRKLESVLKPGESVKEILPQKKGRVILTSKRVLFETREGFHAVERRRIKTLRGTNEKGNRTTVPGKMVSLTIQAEQEYVIKNDCPEFEAFAKQLMKKTGKRKAKG